MTVDDQGRPEPSMAAGELDTLLGFLEFHRATLAWKTSGLDAAALATTVGASTMTLGGLLKHLSFVEDYWFGYRLSGDEPASPWRERDWNSDPDWDWHSAADDTPEQLHELWQRSVEMSRTATQQALSRGGLDELAAREESSRATPNLRWILVHMIEEYARHNGHADLLRESIDGQTGD